MAQVRILYWQDIPSVVEAQDGEGGKHKESLSARFQELIDSVAMRKKLVGTDAYLEGWRRGRPKEREGTALAAAKAVTAELEDTFDQIAQAARQS
jgi:hypothetical protein